MIQILECQVNPVTNNVFGQLSGGHLTINGWLRSLLDLRFSGEISLGLPGTDVATIQMDTKQSYAEDAVFFLPVAEKASFELYQDRLANKLFGLLLERIGEGEVSKYHRVGFLESDEECCFFFKPPARHPRTLSERKKMAEMDKSAQPISIFGPEYDPSRWEIDDDSGDQAEKPGTFRDGEGTASAADRPPSSIDYSRPVEPWMEMLDAIAKHRIGENEDHISDNEVSNEREGGDESWLYEGSLGDDLRELDEQLERMDREQASFKEEMDEWDKDFKLNDKIAELDALCQIREKDKGDQPPDDDNTMAIKRASSWPMSALEMGNYIWEVREDGAELEMELADGEVGAGEDELGEADVGGDLEWDPSNIEDFNMGGPKRERFRLEDEEAWTEMILAIY